MTVGNAAENENKYLENDTQEDDALPVISLQLTPEYGGVRLDKVIAALVPQHSRSRLQQWIEKGHVYVDGKVAKVKTTLYGSEEIIIHPQLAPETQAFKPEPLDIPVVHEDDAILVINKPAGLVVHPAAGNWSSTLLNGLLHRLPQLASVPRAGIVHRLDKDTSGLMVVAKTLAAHTALVRQLQERSVKREYLALVWGTPNTSGTVNAAIGRHPRERIKMSISNSSAAKSAMTHYQRLAKGELNGRAASLVCCQLKTGRTHQIRVHMQSLGFPLVGDALYGKPHLAALFPRQALHAQKLGLVHPDSDVVCEWTSDLPPDMAELLAHAQITTW